MLHFLLSAALFAFAAEPVLSGIQNDHYFPIRPAGVHTSTIVGTLTDYGVGMASGVLSVRVANGRQVTFYLAAPPVRVNGHAIDCRIAPTAGAPQDRRYCAHWPPSLRVGRSRIRVTYWRGMRHGLPTLVTDEIAAAR